MAVTASNVLFVESLIRMMPGARRLVFPCGPILHASLGSVGDVFGGDLVSSVQETKGCSRKEAEVSVQREVDVVLGPEFVEPQGGMHLD
jgi:hypothetical protein